MDSDRWQKIKSVFDAALDLDPNKRAVHVAEACSGDPDLHAEVCRLMDAFDKADGFIEESAANEVASLIMRSKEPLAAGRRFAHYEIIRQIGAGGMGEVYLATDEKLGRRVAIKILNDEFSSHESNIQRFLQEAKAASSLNHPNILVIHEISLSDEVNYIVSEYVEGKTLREVVRDSNLKPSEILDIAIQISGALAAAHSANIVHRDIKPENVVIRPDGYVKILDFGLAKLLESKPAFAVSEADSAKQYHTAQGIIMGTVNYMSPEQAKGEKIDQRTDIFSLGAVIYELVTGKTPFQGNSMSESFANLINKEPQPLSQYTANVPEELQRIVSKTLRKSRKERYQTVQDLQTDLKALREDLDFDERLERSNFPDDKQKTALLHANTVDGADDTGERAAHSTRQIKLGRSFTAAVLGLLVLSIIGFGYYFFWAKKTVSTSDGKKSLAVLPFINASQDPNAEYLSDGITESVINNLSQLSGLRVMSRNSAFRFKNNQTDAKSIASQLGVETLVTGDIRQLGDKLVINVRLIDGTDDSQIWGNQYVKSSADLIAAQNEIAQAVASNLRLRLTSSEQQQLAKRPTENPEALQLYQRGRFHVFKLTPPEILKGISYFQQAIQIDPNYARAYVGLSEAYRSLTLSAEMSPSEMLPKSLAAAQKAVELDDSFSEAHTSLGATLFWQWNWSEAENQYKRALELNPNSSDAHIFYAHLLSNTGRHEEALSEAKRARELEPLFPFLRALEAQFLVHAGRPDEALSRLQEAFELAPGFWMPHVFASSAYIAKGMYAEGISEARKAQELSPMQTSSVSFEGYALAKSGRREEAQALANELIRRSSERFVSGSHIAMIYAGLGENDKALEWLEKGYQQRDPKMTFLKVDLKWDDLRSEPRYIELMNTMNF